MANNISMYYYLGSKATIDEFLKLGKKIRWAEDEVNSKFKNYVHCSTGMYNYNNSITFKVDINHPNESQESQRLEEAIAEYFIFAGTPSFVEKGYKPIENALKSYHQKLKRCLVGGLVGKHVVDR